MKQSPAEQLRTHSAAAPVLDIKANDSRMNAPMFSLLNYFALFLTAIIGILVFDDDPTGVSPQEWILFTVMMYAALSFAKAYRDQLRNDPKGPNDH